MLRQYLVVFQFVITITFIISSILMFKQIKYVQNKALGLNQENVIYFEQSLQIMKHRSTFKQELNKIPGVKSVCFSSDLPIQVGSDTYGVNWRGKNPEAQVSVPYMTVDADFCQTYGVEIVAGRDFNEKYPADTNAVLINQTFAEILGFDEPVGEVLRYWGRKANIIGVIGDFHIGNMHRPIKQLLIPCRPSETYLAQVRIDGNQLQQVIAQIEKTFHAFDGSIPFKHKLVNDQYLSFYKSDNQLSDLSNLFTLLTIIISCLGLFGLALFTAEQRTKEIGIRKTIGAKTSQVMAMLSKRFLRWVMISFVIASILAYFTMSSWLETFAYRISVSWWVFILTGIISVLLAFVTVSWQAFRAANQNPVEALRYE